jgi:citrate lyase beta subunit
MAISGDNPYLNMRSAIETPVLDERKWAKLPGIPSDGVLCDMEDAVPRTRKLEGREAVIRAISNLEQFGDRFVFARPNDLGTEWGKEDVISLGKAGVTAMFLPKVTSAADVLEYQRIVHEYDADPVLVPCIELPGAVARVEEIAAVDQVVAFAFGEGDLTASMGIPIYEPDGQLNPTVQAARARVYLAAATCNVAQFESAFIPDIKDLDAYRARAEQFARRGATGMVAIYPPHVEVINEVFSSTAEDVAYARQVIEAFDAAIASGNPAVQLASGKALLIHDYEKAKRVLRRAGEDF